MKKLLSLGVITLALTIFDATHAANNDELEIRQLSDKYKEAFSRRNPEEIASFWAADAEYINPVTGSIVQGHDALVQEFRNWFQKENIDQLEATIQEISFPEPGVAIEKGTFRMTFKDKPPKEAAFMALLEKEGDQWRFKQIRQIHVGVAPSNVKELQALAWLVGNWINSDETSSIETSTKWDRYKNFLIQRFIMKIYNQPVLDGRQVIGWDPIKKEYRSWLFDSDGGFGEGIWSKVGDTWSVAMRYTLHNGDKASATNVYSNITPDSFTWSSVGRDVNGEIMPNIEPIKVVRMNGGNHEK